MKRIISFIVVSVLLLAMFVFPSAAEEPIYTFEQAITQYEGIAQDEPSDILPDVNGQLYVYLAEGAERVLTSEEVNLRYVYILVCDSEGKIVQAGNNLLKEKRPGFQTELTIPADGFCVSFYYNATNGHTINQDIYDLYCEVLIMYTADATTEIYNKTVDVYGCPHVVSHNGAAVIGEFYEDDGEVSIPSEPEVEGPELDGDVLSGNITAFEGENGVEVNGEIRFFEAGSEDRVIDSTEVNLRYSFLLVFDAEGKLVQAGNNLLTSYDEPAETDQTTVTVPAGGVLLSFFNNADNYANHELLSVYEEAIIGYSADGVLPNNMTIDISGCPFGLTYDKDDLTFEIDLEAFEAEDPVTSGESTEDPSAPEESTTTEDPTSEAPVTSTPATSEDDKTNTSTGTTESEGADKEDDAATTESSEAEKDEEGGNTVLIIVIVVVVVAAIAAAVVIILKKKKA